MKVADDRGRPLDAEASLEQTGEAYRLVCESRGPRRNTDYIPAFSAAIRRLAQVSAVVVDAQVASTQAARLPTDDRRLRPAGYELPICLSPTDDTDRIALALRTAAAAVGRPPEAEGGGNPTKRLELLFELPAFRDQPSGWVEEQILAPSAALEAEAIEQVARPRRTAVGQGRGLDAESKKAVELRAMEVTRQALESDWATVEDVSQNEIIRLPT